MFDGGTAHPRDPHEPDAPGRHRHHLLRHHRASRGGRSAGTRQRDAGAARRERTAELTEVNEALAVAKRKADEANLDKTRFLAAASHDVLQPLNAARLYVTSLVERRWRPPRRSSSRNIDASLEAVEETLDVLIEISRLDAGRLEPEITVFPLTTCSNGWRWSSPTRARERARVAHRAHPPVGAHRTGGCCDACCRTWCPTPSSTPPRARCFSA